MRGWFLFFAIFSVVAVVVTCEEEGEGEAAEGGLARGWPTDVEWHSFAEGLELSKSRGKAMMAIFHKSWCGACKRLKGEIAGKPAAFVEASKGLIMVNVMDEKEADEPSNQPDGGYIPRVLFFHPETGKLMDNVYNTAGSPQYKYYYPGVDGLVAQMTATAKLFPGTPENKEL